MQACDEELSYWGITVVVYAHDMAKQIEMFDDVISRCAAVRTLRAARVMTRHFDDALRPVGLTVTQFTLLITIGRHSPESISEIGQWLSIDRTSLTRNLKPLEAVGYVTRGDEGAGRKRKIALTPAGEDILQKAYPLWEAAQTRVEDSFPGAAYAGAKDVLKTLRRISAE